MERRACHESANRNPLHATLAHGRGTEHRADEGDFSLSDASILVSVFLFLAGSLRRRLANRSYQKLLELPDQPVPAAIKESTTDSSVQDNVVLMSRSTNLEGYSYPEEESS